MQRSKLVWSSRFSIVHIQCLCMCTPACFNALAIGKLSLMKNFLLYFSNVSNKRPRKKLDWRLKRFALTDNEKRFEMIY